VEASRLERPFKESKVLDVVKGMNSEKAPCLNGFSLALFQVCWEVIKADIIRMFHDFQSQYHLHCPHSKENWGH
jgi:hypothetical protein